MMLMLRLLTRLAFFALIVMQISGVKSATAQGIGPPMAGPAAIAVERSGSLVVVDRLNDTVLRVDPDTGDRTILSNRDTGTGPNFSQLMDIAVTADGSLAVVDRNLDAVFRVDPVNGNRRIISGCNRTQNPCPTPLIGSGPPLLRPVSLAVENRGTFVVVDFDARAVLRVDPRTGNRTIISNDERGTGPALEEPMGIAVEASSFLVLADFALDAVVRVHPITGDRTIFSGCPERPDPCPSDLVGSGPAFLRPLDVAVRPNRVVGVIDADLGAVVELNPNTGNRTIVSDPMMGDGPVFLSPLSIAVDSNRQLLIADEIRGALLQVRPAVGTRRIVSQSPTLSISPPGGKYSSQQAFDLALIVEGAIEDVSIRSATLRSTEDVTDALNSCGTEQRLVGSGISIRCENAAEVLGLAPGKHRFDVELDVTFAGGTAISLRSREFWYIIGESEDE